MRTLCPNLYQEDGLETVLEVPIPEEMFASSNNSNKNRSWHNMKSWVRSSTDKSPPPSAFGGNRVAEIQLLLGVVGAPLIPLPISSAHSICGNLKDHAIEVSMAKYIVQQYIAATGGEKALNSIDSMYAMGKVKMAASEFTAGEGVGMSMGSSNHLISNNNGKAMKIKCGGNGVGEVGGFVLWQKRPELWCLELVVSGFKISAGSDGKVAWRQTPWHHSHASRGPPRPLRRSLQGLDPRSTANLFSNSICIGEKTIEKEDCFVLRLEAQSWTLKARSSSNVDVIRHTIWGYFSQRTGLLKQLEDSHLLRIKPLENDGESVLWETTMESHLHDYKTIDGINIAHAGRTAVSLVRYGESTESHSRTQMEEVWKVEEVGFNIVGLSTDCFLAPGDLKKVEEKEQEEGCGGGDRIQSSGLRASSDQFTDTIKSEENVRLGWKEARTIRAVDRRSEPSTGRQPLEVILPRGVVKGNVALPVKKIRGGLSRPVGVSKVADFGLDDFESSKYDEE